MNEIDLCQLDEVKVWLNIADTDSVSEDALLSSLITAESDRIQKYLQLLTIKAKTVDLVFDGTGMQSIVFADQINSIESLSVSGAPINAASDAAGFGYSFSGTRLSLPSGRFIKGLDNCRIRFNVGFEVVPFDIKQACVELVAFRYRERDRIGHASKTIGGETVSFITSEMPASVKQALRPYMAVTPQGRVRR